MASVVPIEYCTGNLEGTGKKPKGDTNLCTADVQATCDKINSSNVHFNPTSWSTCYDLVEGIGNLYFWWLVEAKYIKGNDTKEKSDAKFPKLKKWK
jgi:hypothetical protein